MFDLTSKEEISIVSGGVLGKQISCQCKHEAGDVVATTLLQSYGDECQHWCCHDDHAASYSKILIIELIKKGESAAWVSCAGYSEAEYVRRHKLPI